MSRNFGCPPNYAGAVKVRVNAVFSAGLSKGQQLVAEVQGLSCIDDESQ